MTSPIQELLQGRQVWIPVAGRSMAPVLTPGDEALVAPLRSWPPPTGSIVLLVNATGRFVLHRVCAHDWFWCTTHGLANALPDPPVRRSSVIGVALRRRRGTSGQGVRLLHISTPAAGVIGWAVRSARWLRARLPRR